MYNKVKEADEFVSNKISDYFQSPHCLIAASVQFLRQHYHTKLDLN